MTAATPPLTDLKSTLEELRASMAAEGKRTGLSGAIQDALLRLFSLLLAIVEDFRAGRLAPIAEQAGDGAVAHLSPRPPGSREDGGVRRGSGVANGEARAASRRADREADQRANNAAGAEGAAAGDVGRDAEEMRPEARPSPSRCARRASLTLPLRQAPLGSGSARLADWQRSWRTPPRGHFSKMRLWAKGSARRRRSTFKTIS